MNIDADLVRDLIRRHEGTRLDFKGKQYDWAAVGNAELARDLMAMANALTLDASPAHILIGVDEDPVTKTGVLVGVAPTDHLDDASMHGKVKPKLNRMPDFSYGPVTIDGLSVGVFQIRPGRRPIYPIVDDGKQLKINTPLFRDGSTTLVATPNMVAEWSREDDAEAHEFRALELERMRAALEPRFLIVASGSESGPSGRKQNVTIENTGEATLELVDAKCQWHIAASHIATFGEIEPYETKVTLGQKILRSGVKATFQSQVQGDELARHLKKFIYVDRDLPQNWQVAIAGTFTMEFKTSTGRSATESMTFPFLG